MPATEAQKQWYQRNKDRVSIKSKDRYRNDPVFRKKKIKVASSRCREKIHGSVIKRLYGINKEEYRDLLEKQNGRCAICCEIPTTRRLAVDHSHSTGQVRGLLCIKCNAGIGLLGDSPTVVSAALSYLREHGE